MLTFFGLNLSLPANRRVIFTLQYQRLALPFGALLVCDSGIRPTIMGGRVKAKTYGKRARHRDLVEAFGSLTVSDSNRSPLAERSANASKTLPASPKPIPSDHGVPKTLDKPFSERKKSPQIVPQVVIPVTQVATLDSSPRKRRAATKQTSRPIDKNFTDPLTRIPDVEKLVQQFDQWAETMDKLLEIVMIGDGSYANVFKLSSRSNPKDYSIAKLIPLRPKRGVGSRSVDLTTIENAASEVRVLAKLSGITGFTDFRRAMLLRGQLPQSFRNACKAFDQAARETEKPNQTCARVRRLNYPKQQNWLFVEMGDAGEELEHILRDGFKDSPVVSKISSREARLTVKQTRDIFYSTVEALALGEQEAHFEHRDLHLSNICLKKSEVDKDVSGPEVDWGLIPNGAGFSITLIDYTLSRADTAEGVVFNPMDDEELFCGENNPQYDCYRDMRKAVTRDKEADWSAFVSKTNVIWLHYLLSRLLEKTIRTTKVPQGKHCSE